MVKNEPKGNRVAPIKSLNILINIVHFGPSHIAHNMVGTKEKLMVRIGVFIDKNLDNTIDMASNNAQLKLL